MLRLLPQPYQDCVGLRTRPYATVYEQQVCDFDVRSEASSSTSNIVKHDCSGLGEIGYGLIDDGDKFDSAMNHVLCFIGRMEEPVFTVDVVNVLQRTACKKLTDLVVEAS